MKIHSNHRGARAFSMSELLLILAVIAVIAGLVLAGLDKARDRARRISCISNHKQVAMSFRLFANDQDGAYPFQFLSRPTNSLMFGSPFRTRDTLELWKLIQVAGDALGSPYILVCPSDALRSRALNFNTNGLPGGFALPIHRLNALSYFLSIDAYEGSPQVILMGDRYLTTDPETSWERNTRFLFGQQDFSQGAGLEQKVRWISTFHQGSGNAAFMDGSAQHLTTAKLREAIPNQPVGRANRIWLPNSDATGRGNP